MMRLTVADAAMLPRLLLGPPPPPAGRADKAVSLLVPMLFSRTTSPSTAPSLARLLRVVTRDGQSVRASMGCVRRPSGSISQSLAAHRELRRSSPCTQICYRPVLMHTYTRSGWVGRGGLPPCPAEKRLNIKVIIRVCLV